ncbi:MAG: diaminopimelate epimerase [Lysobacterales bacterium]|jgi:diaminopimelate epimerase
MHGLGNDFVLFDLRKQELDLSADKVQQFANRRTGIGCDQILVLSTATDKDCVVDFDVWNADGSKAEQCGNGVRCIGLYLLLEGEAQTGDFKIHGPVSKISLQKKDNNCFRVDMGIPRFDADKVPTSLNPVDNGYEIQLGEQLCHIGAVSMGNPHALLEVPDLSKADVDGLGVQISTHPGFPQGCNAGFVEVIDRNNINLRVFERGAGETLACGSGACAAVAILGNKGKINKEVLVNQMGGALKIEWTGAAEPVMMTGPAVHLFTGVLI